MKKASMFFISVLLLLLNAAIYAETLDVIIENDITIFKYKDSKAKKIAIAGSFNDWDKSARVLTKTEKDIWQTKFYLPSGTYEYKFVIDDNDWKGQEDGSNLTFTLISKDGKLQLKKSIGQLFKFPGKNTNLTDRLFVYGDYWVTHNLKKETGSKWRTEKPIHSIDINFLLNISPKVEALFQLNALRSNNAKMIAGYNQGWSENSVKIDEGHITYSDGSFSIYGGRGERFFTIAEPSQILDKYSPNFQDGIYIYDEQRPVWYSFGKDYSTIKISKEFEKYRGMLLLSDKQSSNEDLITFRAETKNENFNVGLSFIRSADDDGATISSDPDADNWNEAAVSDANGRIRISKSGSAWERYDTFALVSASGRKYIQNIAIDLSLKTNEMFKLYSQFLHIQSRTPGIAYSDGVNESYYGSNDLPAVSLRKIYGEYYDADKILGGITLNYKNKFKGDLQISFLDSSDKEIAQGTTDLVNVSKKTTVFHLLLKYMTETLNISGILKSKSNSSKTNANYTELFDPYNFRGFEIDNVKSVNEFQLHLDAKPAEKFSILLKNNYADYSIDGSAMCDDIQTNELKFILGYDITSKLQAFAGFRNKNYAIDRLTNSNGAEDYNHSFSNKLFGFKYKFDSNAYVKISYGINYFVNNEDKDITLQSSMASYNRLNFYGGITNSLEKQLQTEDYFKKTDFITLEATLSF